jgi:hypothetical protein
MIYAQDTEWAKTIRIFYECTTDETTEIFETCCLEIEVTVDSKGPPLHTSDKTAKALNSCSIFKRAPNDNRILQNFNDMLRRHQNPVRGTLSADFDVYDLYWVSIDIVKFQEDIENLSFP